MTAARPPRSRSARIILLLAIVDFVLMLFPPLTWIVGQYGIWYFLVTGAVGVLSLMAMYLVDRPAGGQ